MKSRKVKRKSRNKTSKPGDDLVAIVTELMKLTAKQDKRIARLEKEGPRRLIGFSSCDVDAYATHEIPDPEDLEDEI